MTVLTKHMFVNVSGKIGDLQFRQRNGVNFIAQNPDSFIPGTDEASVLRRKNFGLAISFGLAINSVSHLNTLWKAYTPDNMAPVNYMVKQNYHKINDGVISDLAMIVPDWGFGLSATTLELTNTSLSAALSAIGTGAGIDEAVERDIYLAAVVHLSSPVDGVEEPNAFLTLLSASQAIDLINPLTFTIDLDSVEGQMFDAYQTRKVFAALFTVDANDSPVRFSKTLSA